MGLRGSSGPRSAVHRGPSAARGGPGRVSGFKRPPNVRILIWYIVYGTEYMVHSVWYMDKDPTMYEFWDSPRTGT